jgi:hypothetical protein
LFFVWCACVINDAIASPSMAYSDGIIMQNLKLMLWKICEKEEKKNVWELIKFMLIVKKCM